MRKQRESLIFEKKTLMNKIHRDHKKKLWKRKKTPTKKISKKNERMKIKKKEEKKKKGKEKKKWKEIQERN